MKLALTLFTFIQTQISPEYLSLNFHLERFQKKLKHIYHTVHSISTTIIRCIVYLTQLY